MTCSHGRGTVSPGRHRHGVGRRGWVTFVALVIGALALAPPASAQEHGDGHGDGTGLLPPGDWTHEQMAFLLDLIDRTEEALPAYADVGTLEALGFRDFGVTAPGGWDHWINDAWIDDGHVLDPNHPESLVFRHTESGDYVLEAAMFFAPSGHDMSNLPSDLAWLPGWHDHPELCVDEDGTYAGLAAPDGSCSYGSQWDRPPMMHVWIADNGCDHRFAGVGVSGLNCNVGHDHGPGPGPGPGPAPGPGPVPPSTAPPAPTPPPAPGPPSSVTAPVTPRGAPAPARAVASAATPVTAWPDYTG